MVKPLSDHHEMKYEYSRGRGKKENLSVYILKEVGGVHSTT